MPLLTDYKIITDTDIDKFREKVLALPIGKWRPAGSLATSVYVDEMRTPYDNIGTGHKVNVIVYSQAFITD